VRNVHNNEGKYSCFLCEKRFDSKSKLRIHETKHTGEKHLCTLCDKSFNQKRSLLNHQKLNCQEEKSYYCDKCDKVFKRQQRLTMHKKKHCLDSEVFNCDICEKTFSQKSKLTKHMLSCSIKAERIKVEENEGESNIKVEVEDPEDPYQHLDFEMNSESP
jgi:uncharacterized Zn-finger protein